jgi:hypothetical protein
MSEVSNAQVTAIKSVQDLAANYVPYGGSSALASESVFNYNPTTNTLAVPVVDVSSGTLTTDVKSLDISATWNNAGVTFAGVKIAITNTASNAASSFFTVLDGAAGTTERFKIANSSTSVIGGVVTTTNTPILNIVGTWNANLVLDGVLVDITGLLANNASDCFKLSISTLQVMKIGITGRHTFTSRSHTLSMFDVEQTWTNGATNYTSLDWYVTDTASGTEASPYQFRISGSIITRCRKDGAFAIGSSGSFGSTTGPCIFLANGTTIPSTDPTNGSVLYVEAGALKCRGSSGTVTTIGAA